ncbi:MAG: RagB/SusD family nutrient uptake outer membrane protein [Porphyromonas sp.]|nr:RagB/SusD family nutrient uptake outer membrane protein [Bacteroidales bacterium]MDY3100022.1 RagB/SusD family nutrient uptake outer membrane protein [Porphyromonas sp.]
MRTKTGMLLTVALGATILLSGCEKYLNLDNPNQPTDATFWKTEAQFNQAITSCYTPLKVWNGGYYGTRGVMVRNSRADDIIYTADIVDIYRLHRFTNDASNSVIYNIYYQLYNLIYRTNAVLQHLETVELSPEFEKGVAGQAYFLRGLAYFNLAKEFGAVPLRKEASQDLKTFTLKKSSQAEVYDYAGTSFQEAAKLLPMKALPGKPSKGAALAFLGKLYIYTEQWALAETTLSQLTKAPYTYKLMDDYSWNFDEEHEYNAESLFEIIFDAVGGTDMWDNGEGANSSQGTSMAVEYSTKTLGGWSEANVSKNMMDIFLAEKREDGSYDLRATASVAWDYPGCMYYKKPFLDPKNVNETEAKLYWFLKYQNSKTRTEDVEAVPSYINDRTFRYADVLLLLAEADLNQGKIDDAIGFIDQVRTRGSNLPKYSGAKTATAVKAELVRQRAIEFFREGERFYDLRRWGMLKDAIRAQDPQRADQLSEKFYYLPLPTKEIQTNLAAEQSEFWK